MLTTFKIDVDSSEFLLRSCEPKVYRGEVQVNRDGIPKWNVTLIMQHGGENGDIRVTLISESDPCENIGSLSRVRPIDLEIGQWQREDKSGVYFTASAIEKVIN